MSACDAGGRLLIRAAPTAQAVDEGPDMMRSVFGANYHRLVELKNKYDPDNMFRHNQNIEPSRPPLVLGRCLGEVTKLTKVIGHCGKGVGLRGFGLGGSLRLAFPLEVPQQPFERVDE